MTELDNSFAQTTIKDEPKFTAVTDNQVKIEQRPSVTSNQNSAAVTSQSALVKLLTTNSPMTSVKTEPEPENFEFDEAEMQYRKSYFFCFCRCLPLLGHYMTIVFPSLAIVCHLYRRGCKNIAYKKQGLDNFILE